MQSPPFRILLAEDNPANRLIVQKLLSGLPVELVMAENGREAVDLAASGGFGLILMDLQMPVMDGLDAARLIREDERASKRCPVPVVALTAHDTDEDRRVCLEAGFAGFLAKPVSRDALRKTAMAFAALAAVSQAHDVCADPELAELLPMFYDLTRKDLAAMEQALRGGDLDGLARLGHSLKGAAASYCLPGLASLGAKLQAAAKNGAAVQELERLLGEIRDSLPPEGSV